MKITDNVEELPMTWVDRILMLTGLMSDDNLDEYRRRIAIDVAEMFKCPEITLEWLRTGNRSLFDNAREAALYFFDSGIKYSSTWHIIEEIKGMDSVLAASIASTLACLKRPSDNAEQKYLDWAIELVDKQNTEINNG
jgi:hypothetical protein